MLVELFNKFINKTDDNQNSKVSYEDLKTKDETVIKFKSDETNSENIDKEDVTNALDEAYEDAQKESGLSETFKRCQELHEKKTLLERYQIACKNGTLEQDLTKDEIESCKSMMAESYKKQIDSVNEIINNPIDNSFETFQ